MKYLDHPLIHAPFVICFAGLIFWLVILWAFNREKWIDEGKKPLHELKDEFFVMFVGILLAVVWDTQALYLYDVIAEQVFNKTFDTPHEITPEMYLVVGPAIERLYWTGKGVHLKAKQIISAISKRIIIK